jgi:hypothetical protein
LFRVYLESIDYLSSTISQGKAIKTFYSEKVGFNPLFALDETRRFLAILGTTGVSVPFTRITETLTKISPACNSPSHIRLRLGEQVVECPRKRGEPYTLVPRGSTVHPAPLCFRNRGTTSRRERRALSYLFFGHGEL